MVFWLSLAWFPGAQTPTVLVLIVSKLSPYGNKLATGNSKFFSFSQLIIPVKISPLSDEFEGAPREDSD